MNQLLKVVAIGIFSLASIVGYSQEEEKVPVTIPLKEAIEKKIVKVSITGAAQHALFHEVLDRDGVHYGKCMAIVLDSKIDSLVLLRIDSGTELIPIDSTFQTMIVTKTADFPLYPEEVYLTRFYAMCGQIHDAPPVYGVEYGLGELSDSTTVKLARYFEANFIQNMIGQHALWAYTDNADFLELQKYGADSLNIELTKKILNDLSIVAALNKNDKPEIIEIETEEVPKDDGTIQVNKFLIYVVGGIVLVLFITTFYLLFRRRKSEGTV